MGLWSWVLVVITGCLGDFVEELLGELGAVLEVGELVVVVF